MSKQLHTLLQYYASYQKKEKKIIITQSVRKLVLLYKRLRKSECFREAYGYHVVSLHTEDEIELESNVNNYITYCCFSLIILLLFRVNFYTLLVLAFGFHKVFQLSYDNKEIITL